MSLRNKFFAATYDRQMRRVERAGLAAMRAKLVSQATGTVLEIGGGKGRTSLTTGQSSRR